MSENEEVQDKEPEAVTYMKLYAQSLYEMFIDQVKETVDLKTRNKLLLSKCDELAKECDGLKEQIEIVNDENDELREALSERTE